MLSLSLCRLAAAASLLAAIWPAAQAQTPNMPVVRQYGDFAVTNNRHDALVTLSFRRHGYWPGGAREVVEVRSIKATRDGQPMLLAFTKGYTGQGTILIGVQNGEPLMRPISPLQRDNMVRTERDPEWGVPQPGRPEMLLFPRDGRALDTGTGELLWFDVPGNVSGDYPQAMLVSVSPDGRRGAYLTNALTKVGIIVATNMTRLRKMIRRTQGVSMRLMFGSEPTANRDRRPRSCLASTAVEPWPAHAAGRQVRGRL